MDCPLAKLGRFGGENPATHRIRYRTAMERLLMDMKLLFKVASHEATSTVKEGVIKRHYIGLWEVFCDNMN